MLPDKLSDLLELAINDLELVEKDPHYVVDMCCWLVNEKGVCHVCLAGAVLAKSLGFTETVILGIDCPQCMDKLFALDHCRVGQIQRALNRLGQTKTDKFDRWVISYDNDPRMFKAQMKAIVQDLRASEC